MALRFHVPPSWPTPPPGWHPPADWKPDPSWDPAPDGWSFWVEDAAAPTGWPPPSGSASTTSRPRPVRARRFALGGVVILVGALGAAVVLGGFHPTPAPDNNPCVPGDAQTGWTSRFGCATDTSDDWLDGLDRGEGGLLQMSAGPDGFVDATVGMPRAMAAASAALDFDKPFSAGERCGVYPDSPHQIVAITDPQDNIAAYFIFNSAVETHDDIRIGDHLEDLERAYPGLDIAETDDGWAARTQPDTLWDDIAGAYYQGVMVFWLSREQEIMFWAVGLPDSLEVAISGTCSEGGA